MNRLIRRLLTLLFIVGIASGCAHKNSEMTHISATDLLNEIEAGKKPLIIDVRSAWEYDRGHLPGALHMPFWTALWRADKLTASHQERVVVYCEHGPRAGIGRFALHNAGYKKVLYLQGHMTKWRAEGLPVEH